MSIKKIFKKKNRFSKLVESQKDKQIEFETQLRGIRREEFIESVNLLNSYIKSNYDLIQEFIDFLLGIDNKYKVICKVCYEEVTDFSLDKWLDTKIEEAIKRFDEYPVSSGTPWGKYAVFDIGIYVNPNPRYNIIIKVDWDYSQSDDYRRYDPKIKIDIEQAYWRDGHGNKFSYPWKDLELELEEALDIIVEEIIPAISD